MIYQKKILAFIIAILISYGNILAQGSAGNSAIYETRKIIDMPTAGMIGKSNAAIDMKFYTLGSVAFGVDYGIWRNFNAGVSLSIEELIGSASMKIQNIPGVNIKYRFLDEKIYLPALAIGFSTQGSGRYNNSDNRFKVSSPGFFISASKNFIWELGDIAWHAGINHSLENASDDFYLNWFVGCEQSLSARAAVNIEYNSANTERTLGRVNHNGILNLSSRYSFGNGFTLQLQLRDILGSYHHTKKIERFITIEYITRF